MVSDKGKLSNPLALAVLALLSERPMHPYEIAFLMRQRHLHESIKLNYGSLYTVVDVLQRGGLIEPQETLREGRRPERTVYALTDTGHLKLFGWLRELLRKPVKEYSQFTAGLAFMAHLPRSEVLELLEERTQLLQDALGGMQFAFDTLLEGSEETPAVPRLFLLEMEYALKQGHAELDWLRTVIGQIKDGTLEWVVDIPERRTMDEAETRKETHG